MAISERIHFFRNLRGMTQKYLGLQLGFPDKSADVRMAQYETGSRTPKADITAALAQVLDVAPEALNVPDVDSYIGLMHTLFALEDIYGIILVLIICSLVSQVFSFNFGRTSFSYNSVKVLNGIVMSAFFSVRNARSHSCASRLVAKPRFNFCCRKPCQSV